MMEEWVNEEVECGLLEGAGSSYREKNLKLNKSNEAKEGLKEN